MSHFTVLVIGDNPEEQLAPFQENNMGDCPKEYLEFHDTEDEYLKEYENDGTEMVLLPDGKLVYPHDEMFRDKKTWKTEVPETYKRTHVKHSTKYATFEEFMSEWAGYEERDELMNRYGYWENPNSKWDWYQLGGRWMGFFKIKSGCEGLLGRPGVFGNEPRTGYCDSLRYSEIDFEGMRAIARSEAEDRLDKVLKVINNRPLPRWSEVRERWGSKNIEKARNEYNSNEVVKDLEKAQLMPFLDDIYDVYCDFNRDAYLRKCENQCIVTHAVVYNGKWYEHGEMGWWGMQSNEKDDNDWYKEYRKLIDGLPENTLLSVYDCHI